MPVRAAVALFFDISKKVPLPQISNFSWEIAQERGRHGFPRRVTRSAAYITIFCLVVVRSGLNLPLFPFPWDTEGACPSNPFMQSDVTVTAWKCCHSIQCKGGRISHGRISKSGCKIPRTTLQLIFMNLVSYLGRSCSIFQAKYGKNGAFLTALVLVARRTPEGKCQPGHGRLGSMKSAQDKSTEFI